jgi:mevalonate kinase
MMQVPAKTFLIGEYVAMFGGPALLSLTHACFSIDTSARLHKECPASRFWLSETGKACDWGLQDPYQGRGGLGASSAEFLLAYRQLYPKAYDLNHLYSCYQTFAHQGRGLPPSGYDLLAQTKEGCVVMEANPFRAHMSTWNFTDLGFVLVHTGKKLATHAHLSQLQTLEWKTLVADVEYACQAILENQADRFLAAVQGFTAQLFQLGLVAKHTQFLLEELNQHLPLLASKGCGAMGSDVIVLFALRENIDNIVDFLQKKSLYVLATHRDLYFEDAKT